MINKDKSFTNPNIDLLDDYPFKRLNNLIKKTTPPKNKKIIILSLGEPSHSPPKYLKKKINDNFKDWSKYPPSLGTKKLNTSCLNWLRRRFKIPTNFLREEKHILQVAGTREGLFNIALAINPQQNKKEKAVTLMPDPFYQVYAGAAVMSGSEPVAVPSLEKNRFIPCFEKVNNKILNRTTLIYICSPSNPEGTSLTLKEWESLINFSKKIGAILVADECYSEIYVNKPPVGILQACYKMNKSLKNIVSFHSLSKRSNVPGLRSGFVVGDSKIIDTYKKLRHYCAGQQPLPIQEAASSLWDDDDHAIENRKKYKLKFKIAKKILQNKGNFTIPDGGFYIWLKVKNDEIFTKTLWGRYGVKVMPGSYLSKSSFAKSYVRIALVESNLNISKALKAISCLLEEN